MDSKTSRQICQLVSGIIVADDDLDPAEQAFVERVFRKFGLEGKLRRSLFPTVDREEAARTLRGFPEDTQDYALKVLIEAASADGKIVGTERALLESMAHAMGLTDDELTERIEQQLNSLESVIPASVDFKGSGPAVPPMAPLPDFGSLTPPASAPLVTSETTDITQSPVVEDESTAVSAGGDAPTAGDGEARVSDSDADDILGDAATLQDGKVLASDVAANVVIAPDEPPAAAEDPDAGKEPDASDNAADSSDVDAGW